MNARILLLFAGVAALSSCSSVYKTGQTPDDVYYSPARPQEEYVQVQQRNEDRYQTYDQYQDSYRNDRFLRMSVGNPYYMNAYNMYGGFDWRYNSYAYDFYSPWNNYWYWNSFYNPYYPPYGNYYGYSYLKQPLYTQYTRPVSRPVSFNPNSYSGNSRTIYNRNAPGAPANYYYPSGNNNTPRYNNGNTIQRIFGNNSHNNNSYTPSRTETYTPTRSYTPSSSSSSGSSSSGSSSGGVSRPGRGGR
jgi:hypothetical protein